MTFEQAWKEITNDDPAFRVTDKVLAALFYARGVATQQVLQETQPAARAAA